MSTQQLVQMAAKLYAAIDTVRRLWTNEWRDKLREPTHVLMTLMEREHCNEIEAMIRVGKDVVLHDHDAHAVILFMEACVEMVEPTDPRAKDKTAFLRKEYQEYLNNGGAHDWPTFYRDFIDYYTWDSVLPDTEAASR